MLLASLVRSTVVPVRGVGAESLMLESLLVAGESIITYRRRYRSRAQLETVLDLLLLEPDNPRSLAYQLDQLTEGVERAARPSQVRLSDEERLVLEVSTMLRVADTVGAGPALAVRSHAAAQPRRPAGGHRDPARPCGRGDRAQPLLPPGGGPSARGRTLRLARRAARLLDAVKLRIVHRTSYRYDADVSANYNEVHLVPRSLPTQTCLSNELVIEPHPSDFHERVDYFGNGVAFFSVQSPHRALTVTATSTVEATDRPTEGEGWSGEPWEQSLARFADHADTELIEARPYVLDSPLVARGGAARRVRGAVVHARPPGARGGARPHQAHPRRLRLRPGATTIATELDDVLDQREGVCQDFAHVAIAAVRSMGLPARYVSGYLETLAPPGSEKLTGVDASHAWFSVFAPGTGWVDFDPTNDRVPNERYVTTAWGRDYADVTPIKGIVFSSGGGHELTVAVDVVRLDA